MARLSSTIAALAGLGLAAGACVTDVTIGGVAPSGAGGSQSGVGGSSVVTVGVSSTSGSGGSSCPIGVCGTSCTIETCQGEACSVSQGYCDGQGNCTATPVPCPQSCAGLSCGAPCNPTCAPGMTCSGPEQGFFCDQNLQCSPGPLCCGSCTDYDECANAPCGRECHPCDPTQDPVDCAVEGNACDGSGNCVPVFQVACPADYQPCAALPCGMACSPCDPNSNTDCTSPSYGTVCDGEGSCIDPGDPAFVQCGTYCAGKLCGDDCYICDPMDPICQDQMMANEPDGTCDMFGKCVVSVMPLYCPCNKGDVPSGCGSKCTVCDPNGGDCNDPSGASMCDGQGHCVPEAMCM